jgi:GNAT superfamily N-acetyltransferase
MTVELEALDPWSAGRFRGLVARSTRELLEVAHADGHVVAVGAAVDGLPAGIALARLGPAGTFSLETLYVARERRGRGLGTKLLRHLEDLLGTRAVPALRWFRAVSDPMDPDGERWLADRGWSTDGTLRVFECSGSVSREAWFDRARLPADVDVFRWGTLSARRRAAIERPLRAAGWVPEAVAPWSFPTLDPGSSLGVSRGGEIVGWALTQPVSSTQLRYAALCARPDVRHLGLGHQMLAEAIRRQVRAMGEPCSGLFTIAGDNEPMLRVLEKRLKRHLLSSTDVRVMTRALA